jgi:hypothetical protein
MSLIAIAAANLGPQEMIILLVVLGIPGSVALLVVLAVRASNRRSSMTTPVGSAWVAGAPATAPVGAIGPQWAADPFGRHQLRYFDGKVWTSHVSDNSVLSQDDPGQ